jgi:hypothetical protein
MPNNEMIFKDPDGFHYKHPERSCKRCKKYPCLEGMEVLKGDHAKYGCVYWDDINVFEWKR